MKKRKPRTKSEELGFDGAHQFGREIQVIPLSRGRFTNTPAVKKLLKRLESGLCLGCGKRPCKCKSKL